MKWKEIHGNDKYGRKQKFIKEDNYTNTNSKLNFLELITNQSKRTEQTLENYFNLHVSVY